MSRSLVLASHAALGLAGMGCLWASMTLSSVPHAPQGLLPPTDMLVVALLMAAGAICIWKGGAGLWSMPGRA